MRTPGFRERSGRWGTAFLLVDAALWLAGCVITTVVMLVILQLAPALMRLAGLPQAVAPSRIVTLLAAAFGFQGSLLLGAFWRGRTLGGGDWRRGLGVRPLRDRRLIVILCGLMIVWLGALLALVSVFPRLGELAKSSTPELLSAMNKGGLEVVLPGVILVAILAPLSEELFFRGWLWEAMRRRGHGIKAIAAAVMLPWLALHGIDSPVRLLFLLPATATIFAARHLGGGVRASILVHVTNNAAAVLLEVAASWSTHPT